MTLLQKLRCSLSYSNKLLKSEHTALATKQPLSEYAKEIKADYLPKSKSVTQIWVNNRHIFLLIAIKPFRVLTNLERCVFISRNQNFGHKVKDTIYRLVDFYTLFYYKFILQDISGDEHWWSHNFESRQISTWQGLTFEIVCLMHTGCIKRALGISGMATEVSSWRKVASEDQKGGQIDLVIKRADRIIHLCEMKFSKSEYRITEAYEQLLRQRLELFQSSTKTKFSLVITFVTTYGVADGAHHSLVHSEVTMEQLFK